MLSLVNIYHKLYNPIVWSMRMAEDNCRQTSNGWETTVMVRTLTLTVKVNSYDYKDPRFIVEIVGFGLAYIAPISNSCKQILLDTLAKFLTYTYNDPLYFGDIEECCQRAVSC